MSFYLIDVNMGYGHQRTAYSLSEFAKKEGWWGKGVIHANFYQGIPEKDRKIWQNSKKTYETISRMKRIPLIGNSLFNIYDRFQRILSYYPKRDLSKPTINLKTVYSLIKNGWGKDLILKLKREPLPIVTTFYIPAFMAEVFNYPEKIYCIVCDADIARHWAPLLPKNSKIKYFAPCDWVEDRLKLYGLTKDNIVLTGYPLPKELVGNNNQIVKEDLKNRLFNLDPKRKYFSKYGVLVEKYVGEIPKKSNHPLSLMFSIGGAGAQKEIALSILKSLKEDIKKEKIKFIISVGIRKKLKEYFEEKIKQLNLSESLYLKDNLEIIFAPDIKTYFQKFNLALKKTDILWTKPSELSFFAGLGIPIIIAPSIGSQEDFNKRWLLYRGSGILQENPKYTNQWLFDYLNSGKFAEIAMKGFIEIEKRGTYNIKKELNFQKV